VQLFRSLWLADPALFSRLTEAPWGADTYLADMELELRGKTAVVTGASRGIGLAIVQALLDEGVTVIGAARRPPQPQVGGHRSQDSPSSLGCRRARVPSTATGSGFRDAVVPRASCDCVSSRATGTTPSEVRAGAEAAIPTGRFTQPREVAQLVLVLASSTFGNITGADFVIDGGMRPTV
jgi:NAD(P)-dependent dehydrogenase (short-subunit alcohol dehydrogenase family)